MHVKILNPNDLISGMDFLNSFLVSILFSIFLRFLWGHLLSRWVKFVSKLYSLEDVFKFLLTDDDGYLVDNGIRKSYCYFENYFRFDWRSIYSFNLGCYLLFFYKEYI